MTFITPSPSSLKLLSFLEEVGLDYFSLTVYDRHHLPLYSSCNNPQWIDVYKKKFLPKPPVQDYITSENKSLIVWGVHHFCEEIARYVHIRNEVCRLSSVCTFLARGHDHLCALSFGSTDDTSHIFRTFHHNKSYMMKLFECFLSHSFEPNKRPTVRLSASDALLLREKGV